MDLLLISFLNGISYGLLLFMLASGFTLIFGMMGVLNFAHASFYMLGAYFAYQLSLSLGFWWALFLAPLSVGVIGALIEYFLLRRVHYLGHIPELLLTFGISLIIGEIIRWIWGASSVDYQIPSQLSGTLLTIGHTGFAIYRAFIMIIALIMMGIIYVLLNWTQIGLIIRAALTHPKMVEALGHNVPAIFTLVFAIGTGLAGLAGVIGGNFLVTEPNMANDLGSIIFVIVMVGGMGSLRGAFLAALLLGTIQSFATVMNYSVADLLMQGGISVPTSFVLQVFSEITLAKLAPLLPYVLLIIVLWLKPSGLMGIKS